MLLLDYSLSMAHRTHRHCCISTTGGPLLVVDGVQHKTHSHKMAVGSEVHVVTRTEPANGRGTSVGCLQAEGQAPRKGEQTRTTPSMSIFASLHRKLIVQQVLVESVYHYRSNYSGGGTEKQGGGKVLFPPLRNIPLVYT